MNNVPCLTGTIRRHFTTYRVFVTLFVTFLLMGPSAVAQQQNGDGNGSDTGTVTGSDVYVRGGPGKKYKPIGRVDKGTSVRIVGREAEWIEVEPPAGTSVWILGSYVKRSEDGGEDGKVTGTNVNVRPLPRADRSNSPLGQVSSPAGVTILEEKNVSGYEDPWYRIPVPEGITAWIHSDYVRVGEPASTDDAGEDSEEENQDEADAPEETSGDNAGQTSGGPQKGEPAAGDENGTPSDGEGPQKGESPGKATKNTEGDETEGTDSDNASTDQKKWVERLKSIRESIRNEKKKDKLEWDFQEQITSLRTYRENCPIDVLKTRAGEIREQLEQTQAVVENERSGLNETLAEIREERKRSVRQSLQAVMEAKGFKWTATGFVRPVGSVIGRPTRFQLNKGGERLYFIKADVYDLSNFRGREVAVSGEVLEDAAPGWDWPVLKVKTLKIME